MTRNDADVIETSSSSSGSSPQRAVEEGVELERGTRPGSKALEKAAGVPWYCQTRLLVVIALLLIVGAGAGIAVAFTAGNDSSSSSSSSSSNNDNNENKSPPTPTPPPPPPVPSTPEPTTPLTPQPTPEGTPEPTVPVTPSPTSSLAPTEFPTPSPTMPVVDDPFSFYVMGDIPYTQLQRALLQEQVAELKLDNNSAAVFAVHVGDMMGHRAECAGSFIESVAADLLEMPVPTLVLAGDNDWLDCPDPNLAWENYMDVFVNVPFEQWWLGNNTLPLPARFQVTRSAMRPSHFSFMHNGILALSIDIWQGQTQFEDINVAWFTDRVHAAFNATQIRGVVLFGHAEREQQIRPFFERIAPLFYDRTTGNYIREVPVMYMHGDGHQWNVGTRFATQLGWDLFIDIMVDQGAAAPPILVDVAGGSILDPDFVPLEEESEWHYVFGRGLFRIDRRGGTYPGF